MDALRTRYDPGPHRTHVYDDPEVHQFAMNPSKVLLASDVNTICMKGCSAVVSDVVFKSTSALPPLSRRSSSTPESHKAVAQRLTTT